MIVVVRKSHPTMGDMRNEEDEDTNREAYKQQIGQLLMFISKKILTQMSASDGHILLRLLRLLQLNLHMDRKTKIIRI